jgi:hypothetical protein
MTYRTGVFAVDTSTGKLGQIMDTTGLHVHLRPVGGGKEWTCPPKALRLATREEREAAGVRADEETRA